MNCPSTRASLSMACCRWASPTRVLLQEGMLLRVEQPAVEGGDMQRRLAVVDVAEQFFQLRPQPRAGGQQALSAA